MVPLGETWKEVRETAKVDSLVRGGKRTSHALKLAVLLAYHFLSSQPLAAMPTTQKVLLTSLFYWLKLEIEEISSCNVHVQTDDTIPIVQSQESLVLSAYGPILALVQSS